MKKNSIWANNREYENLIQNLEMTLCAILFLLFPVLAMPYLLYKIGTEKNNKRRYVYLTLFCVAMGFLAYHTVPLESDDLSRHYANMKVLQFTDFKDIFHSSYSLVYLNTLIMAIFAKMGTYQLYPMLYIVVGYGLIFYVYAKLTDKKKLYFSEKIGILLFVLFAVNCRDFISGLRNYFSFIVCMYLIVANKVFHQKKIVTYLGILCVSFIHTSAIAFLVWELISDLPENKILKRVITISIFLTLPALFIVSQGFIPFVPQTIVEKLDMYISTAHIINLKVYLYQMGIVFLMVCCHLINRRNHIKKFEKINNFLDYYLVFMLAIIPIMTFLSRFVSFLVAISPVILVQTYYALRKNRKMRYIFTGILGCFILAGILMLLASMRAYPWNFSVKNIFIWWL